MRSTSVSADIFTARLVFTEKNLLILCILYSGELKKANLTFWSFLVQFGSCFKP